MQIEFDTPFDHQFGLYTRANAGEVFPEVLGPLAWSLVGAGAEEGFRRAFADDFGALRRPDAPWLAVGRFAGRFHLNMSVVRLVAERLPGTSAAEADGQYFGDTGGRGLPPHTRCAADRLWALRTAPAALRTMAVLDRRVARGTREVSATVAENEEFLAAAPSDTALVSRLVDLRRAYSRPFGLHITNRALTSTALSLASRALRRRGIVEADALAMLSRIPDRESAKPGAALHEIASTVDPESPLGDLVSARVGLDELARADAPGCAALAERLRWFLDEFGHRGVNEFDPTYPAWEQDPGPVLAMLRSLLGEPGPARVAAAPPPGTATRLDPLTAKLVSDARRAVRRAELTKNDIIRFTHAMRRVVWMLARRWSDRVHRAELHLLTVEELAALARGEAPPHETITRRRAELDAAAEIEPALWSNGSLAVDPVEPSRQANRIVGVAGSTGVAQGRVRVCTDPLDDFRRGEVLVAKFTDTAWTPLFLAAAAVVTDVGSVLSHATIVARELGIPAVVDTRVGTVELRDGDVVEVDGGLGVVRLLDRRV